MRTVIYIDVLVLINFILAYGFLGITGRITGQTASFGRQLAAAGLAAVSALVLFFPPMPYALQVGYKLLCAAGICLAAFGCRKCRLFVTSVCWYAGLNVLMAGIVLLASGSDNTAYAQENNLTVYLRVSPWLLILCCGGLCLAGEVWSRWSTSRRGRCDKTVGLVLTTEEGDFRLRAALDTACHLKDPITCMPVLLISFPDSSNRLPQSWRAFLSAWFEGENVPTPDGMSLRLVPCTTASGQALLPGAVLKQAGIITGKGTLYLGRTAVAFTRQSFANDAYEALYGPDFL